MVQGQPKGASEYIQATSRVGRLPTKPGLILALLNAHKPRDRLHFEGFRYFHACFYRAVEATSVTPWAARALDRALAAVIIGVARHVQPELTQEPTAAEIVSYPGLRTEIIRTIVDRAPAGAVAGGHPALAKAIEAILDDWDKLADDHRANSETFYYGYPREKSLLHDPLDPLLDSIDPRYRRFTAGRSMRDVEHVSVLKVMDQFGQPLTGK